MPLVDFTRPTSILDMLRILRTLRRNPVHPHFSQSTYDSKIILLRASPC